MAIPIVKNQMVARKSHIYNEYPNFYAWKDGIYVETRPQSIYIQDSSFLSNHGSQ